MFHNIGHNPNPYGANSNAPASQAPAPRPAEHTFPQEPVVRFANMTIEHGVVPGLTWLPSGIQANRQAHVHARVENARRQHVASSMGMSKEDYIRGAVASTMRQLPAHLQYALAREDAATLAEQTWEVLAAPYAEAWNNSAAHQNTIALATQEWDREAIPWATALAQQYHMTQARGPSLAPAPQPGANRWAAALRSDYARETNVFDDAFGAALAGSLGPSDADDLIRQFDHLSSDDASESAASPGAVADSNGKRKAAGLPEPSENKRGKMRARTASEEREPLPDVPPGSHRDTDGEWEVAPEHYRDLDNPLRHGTDGHGAGPALRAQTASPAPGAAAQQAPGIPPSREGSVDRLIEEVSLTAQIQKARKQAPRFLTNFRKGVDALNAKEGRSRIDPEQGLARYKEQSQKRQPAPPERRAQEAERKRRKAAPNQGSAT